MVLKELILRWLNIHHHKDSIWSLNPVIKYMTPVQILTSYSSKIHIYVVLS
jgi:hypothetical protein